MGDNVTVTKKNDGDAQNDDDDIKKVDITNTKEENIQTHIPSSNDIDKIDKNDKNDKNENQNDGTINNDDDKKNDDDDDNVTKKNDGDAQNDDDDIKKVDITNTKEENIQTHI